jgi:preprotein translocase subunit SecG
MYEILLFVFLLVAIALVGIILIQNGKGADMGASFGSGASGTVFGAPGAGNFLTKATSFLALMFFAVALALAYMTSNTEKKKDGFWESEQAAEEVVVPASEIPTEQPAASDIPSSDIPASDIPAVEDTVKEAAKEAVSEEKAEEKEDKGGN